MRSFTMHNIRHTGELWQKQVSVLYKEGKYSVTCMMGKREASLSLKGTKWVSSRAGSRSKESWLIIYSIHEAVHRSASKWYNSQPSYSSSWKCLCKNAARLGALCLLWLMMTQNMISFTESITETVFCSVHCNDSYSNACHASITVMTPNMLHPVLDRNE